MDGVIGFTTLFAGNFAPRNWAFCNGQVIPIQQNTALFSIIGTYYGGDGKTTFCLPDLRGRAVVGAGQGLGLPPYVIGEVGGTESYTMIPNNMPSHTHGLTIQLTPGSNGTVNSTSPENAYYATGTNAIYNYSENDNMLGFDGVLTFSNTGNSVALPTLDPVLALNYIICLSGTFPARN